MWNADFGFFYSAICSPKSEITEMIEEIGTICQVHDTTARVRVQKRGTCDGCMASSVCESSENGMEIEALNPLKATKGQTVKLSIKPQVYLRGTIYVYGFPLAAFIAGVILGKNIGESYFSEVNSDLVSVALGFVLLVLSFFIVRLWSKKAESKPEYKPVIEEILK